MLEMPQTLMRGDKRLTTAALLDGRGEVGPGHRTARDDQQLGGGIEIRLIAGVMERDQYLVAQPTPGAN